jgi:hypothetical protein
MDAQRIAGPGEYNHALFDVYSLAHGSVGVIAALVLGLGFWATLALAAGWEVVEHVGKNFAPSLFPYPTQDTFVNSVGDVLSTLIGWSIGKLVSRRGGAAGAGDRPRAG